jgi:hypothetical protein
MPDPIVIPCEGSGHPTHNHGHARGMCSMCGQLTVTEDDGRAYQHNRQDVLAMLRRGDFAKPTSVHSRGEARS